MFVYNDTIAMYSDLMRLSLVEIPQHFLTKTIHVALNITKTAQKETLNRKTEKTIKKNITIFPTSDIIFMLPANVCMEIETSSR